MNMRSMHMNWKNAVACALASAVTLSIVTPLSAATRSSTGVAKVASSKKVMHRRAHAQMPFAPAAGSYAYAPGPDAHAPGSWHINQNGLPYRVPDLCAFPREAGSDGAAIFQRFGCHLP
jgi:hypothetical protein